MGTSKKCCQEEPLPKIAQDLTGSRFGRLTVIGRAARRGYHLCRCDCGTERSIYYNSLLKGLSKSCGCLRRKHGLWRHPLYRKYRSILGRCYCPGTNGYACYGGRGIVVCDEWLRDFTSFYCWATQNGWVPGLQIDRINVDGPYSPDNCRFVTGKTNSNNKRTNNVLTLNGKTQTLQRRVDELAVVSAVNPRTLQARIRSGRSLEQVLCQRTLGLKKVAKCDKTTGEVLEVFDGIVDAGTKYGFDTSHIVKCCKGKIKSIYGFAWRYF